MDIETVEDLLLTVMAVGLCLFLITIVSPLIIGIDIDPTSLGFQIGFGGFGSMCISIVLLYVITPVRR